MDVAFSASSSAYADNVLDTWAAYCANHERVPLHLTRNLVPLYRPHVPYPELLRADNLRHGRGSKRLVVCASYTDMVAARGQPVVLMEHGIGQTWCLGPETRVLTGDLRWIPVEDLTPGQELVGFDEKVSFRSGRRWRRAYVTRLASVKRQCYRLHLADGTKIVSSAEHRWLKYDCQTHGWSETRRLQGADKYPKRSSKLVRLAPTWDTDTSWGSGYLAAAFDGEGSLCQTTRQERSNHLMISFTQRPNAMLEQVKRELDNRGFKYQAAEHSPQVNRFSDRPIVVLNLRGGVGEMLRFLGQVRPSRFLDQFKPIESGRMHGVPVEVLEVEPIGEQWVTGVETTTGTLIAEGFASHNSSLNSGSYAGGPGRDAVVCFLCPNEHSALANRIRNPHARVEVIGSPLLAALSQIPHTPTDPPTIATGWHWAPNPRMTPPEMQPAFPVYASAFADLHDNYRLLAHAHPRYQDVVFPAMRARGIECEPDFRQVVARASVLVTDISSSGYLWAGLHRPTVWCNLPTYRPDVDAYPRFGPNRLVPGIEVDTPNELGFAVQVALADPTHLQIARLDCNRAIFPLRDGRSAERAAAVIADVAGTL